MFFSNNERNIIAGICCLSLLVFFLPLISIQASPPIMHEEKCPDWKCPRRFEPNCKREANIL